VPSDDLQYELLRQLTRDPAASQRSLAARYGVSVGKMNYCLRALVHKGLVKANNFRRSDNKLAYAYVLTPAGIDEKAKLAKAFLQRKVAEFEQIQREIAELRSETREIAEAHASAPAAAATEAAPK
jgi:MarR family transcriptional regulator, temperature-dependent positive regulator of motility